MLGVAFIASRAASRRAILIGVVGMATTAVLVDRIAVAGADSALTQGCPHQRIRSPPSILTRFDDGVQFRPQIGERQRPSLPPYFPLE
jgi:hypothetical protein